MSDRGDAVRRLVASLEKDEQETKIIRADLEALQAAVRGLTGKEGDVAEMVTDLAGVGRDIAALKAAVEAATGQKRDKVADLVLDLGAAVGSWEAITEQKIAAAQDREALEARIQVAQVALDAVRLAAPGREAPFYDALDRLDRALRGVPAADRGRQGAPATIEARLAEVERLIGSMSDHLAALDQRVAGLGNGLDDVRRPKVVLFGTERGDLRVYCARRRSRP